MPNEQKEVGQESPPEQANWEEFGFDVAEVPAWTALGFGPFEAAIAHGDGYTPMFAAEYTGPLKKMAARWNRVGLGTSEGLRWHLAGFSPKGAVRWRTLGIEVKAARTRRSGYGGADR